MGLEKETISYKELLQMVHEVELQIQKLADGQKFLNEKVYQIADEVSKLIKQYAEIEFLKKEILELKRQETENHKRIKEIEKYMTESASIKKLFSHWYKLPIAIAILAAVFEAGKSGFFGRLIK